MPVSGIRAYVAQGEAGLPALMRAVHQQAVRDVRIRWEGRGANRRRIQCDDHDACRCALERLKTIREMRKQAARGELDSVEVVTRLFAA